MKVGMIIVFNFDDEEILSSNIIEIFKKTTEINFCLVNNNCPNMFGEVLMDIADECENVTVIHIKKRKNNSLAVRAGTRYMSNQFNLKFLGHLVGLHGEKLIEAIQLFVNRYEEIRTQEGKHQSGKLIKQAFFQKIFSVPNRMSKSILS